MEPLFKFLRLCMGRDGKLPSNLTPKILVAKFAAWKKLTGVKDAVHKMRKRTKETAKPKSRAVLRQSRRMSHARKGRDERKAKGEGRVQNKVKAQNKLK